MTRAVFLAAIVAALPVTAFAAKPAPAPTAPTFASFTTPRVKVADPSDDNQLYGDGRGVVRAGSQLLVAFVDASRKSVWLSRSLDGGLTWRLARRVAEASPQGGGSGSTWTFDVGPRAALAVGPEPMRADLYRVHVAYRDTSWDAATGTSIPVLKYTHATLDPAAGAAGLGQFTAPHTISGGVTSLSPYELTMVADVLGGVHVAAGAIQSGGGYFIMYSRSLDHGDSFVETGTAAPWGGAYPGYPALATAPTGEVFLAWVAGQNDLWVARRSPGAASFDAPVLAAPNFSNPEITIAAADANRIYVASSYFDTLYVARSTDGGSTWWIAAGPTGSVQALGASIAVSATGTVGLAWADASSNQLGYARSTDGGATWTPPAKVGGGNMAATVVFDAAGKANIVFTDQQDSTVLWFAKEQ